MTTVLVAAIIGALVGVIAVLAYRLHQARVEIQYRDRHLAWVDRRDARLVELFSRVSEARVVPMTNPLDGMKQYGMLTRNAMDNARTYLAEMDERLTHAQGFLKRAIAAAKEVEYWESQNPAPPVRPGDEQREANVAKPMPIVDTSYGATAANPSPLPASFVKPKPLGKGVFGPEQEDEEEPEPGLKDGAPRPRRRVRDNPQA